MEVCQKMTHLILHLDEKNFKLHPAIQIKITIKNAYNKNNVFQIKILL